MDRSAKRHVEQLLASPKPPASARITFRGRPVIGTHAVFAEFGAKAMAAFSETVVALAASQEAPLAGMGPLPNREQHQLLITGAALGSFGFEVEEHQPDTSLFLEDSALALAMAQTVELLRSVGGTDDELTEAVAGVEAYFTNASSDAKSQALVEHLDTVCHCTCCV